MDLVVRVASVQRLSPFAIDIVMQESRGRTVGPEAVRSVEEEEGTEAWLALWRERCAEAETKPICWGHGQMTPLAKSTCEIANI